MNTKISQLIEKIRSLEEELEIELAQRREELNFSFENKKVIFEQEVTRLHKQLKTRIIPYILQANFKVMATAPFIYALIIPLLLLDLLASLYQRVSFPVYGIAIVKRRHYFVFDRHHLAYLNVIEKINCAYCSYGNGVIAYVREIASRTEQYWCPIKHAQRLKAAHTRYHDFIDYGDAESYQKFLEKLDQELKERAKPES